MSFAVDIIKYGSRCSITLKDVGANTSAEIYSFGALLNSFSAAHSNGSINVIEGYSSIDNAVETITPLFKSARLSPYVCRVKNAQYSFEGNNYQLSKYSSHGNALHGLMYDAGFEISKHAANENEAWVELECTYSNGLEGYPFSYKCNVMYKLLAGNKLTVKTTVTNYGKGSIPVTDGWHPYFSLGNNINDYEVSFQSTAMLEFDEALIPTGTLLPYDSFVSPKQFGTTFFDNCFMLNMQGEGPKCIIRNPRNGVQVEFYPERAYPYLQFYTPDLRKSIAVENLSAAPDAFNNGMGLKILEPGDSAIFTVSYVIRTT